MFVIRFLKNLLIENKFKSILILVCALSLHFHLNQPYSEKSEKTFYSKFKFPQDTTATVYIIPDKSDAGFTLIKLKKSEHSSSGNKITYQTPNGFFWLPTIMGSLCLIILLGMTIWGDEDHNWNVQKCLIKSHLRSIGFEVENSTYFYHLNGKVIYKGAQKPSSGDLIKGVKNFIEHSNLLENFEGTTQKKRNNKLDKILK
jgi:hypothetical protein